MKPNIRAASILLVLLVLQGLAVWLVESGRVDLPHTPTDRLISVSLSLVMLSACLGLFRGARWGWYAALVAILGSLLDGFRTSIVGEEFGFPSIFALGVWIALSSLLLRVLDSKSLRGSLEPEPPSLDLRWRLVAQVGIAAAAVSLIGSIWGFLILGLWFGLMAWKRRRKPAE